MSARQGISLLVLGAIHLIFLIGLFGTNSNNVGLQSVIISSLVLLVFGYARSLGDQVQQAKTEVFIYPFAIALAGILTYFVSVGLHFGPVIASAGVGFIASYLTVFKSPLLKSLPVPIYCGTFVGMCSGFLAEDYFFVAYAGLVAGLIYIFTRDALNGVGGKLGTIAFGGVVVVSFIFSML